MVVHLPYKDRFQGLTIVGVTETGKTTFKTSLFLHDIGNGLGGLLVEPHGDLTKTVIAGIPEHRLDDVILLDFTDADFPFAINLFACPQPRTIQNMSAAANLVSSLFHELWSAGFETPRLMEVLRAVTYTLLENPGSTLCEVGFLFSNDTVWAKMVANVTNPEIVAFWEGYNRLSQRDRGQLIESTLNKFRAYSTEPLLRNILGQSETSLSFRRLMDDSKILLMLLSPRFEEASRLIGALILTQLQMAAFSRSDTPEERRRPFMLFIDEFQRWDFGAMAVFIHEARKWKIASCFAFQTLQALSEANRAAVLACGSLMVFRVSGLDAPVLARQFDATPPPQLIGVEPIHVPVTDCIDHLVKYGHSDPRVAHFSQGELRNFEHFMRESHPIAYCRLVHGGMLLIHPVDMRAGRALLNETFARCMRERNPQVSIPPLALYLLAAAQKDYSEWSMERFVKSTGLFYDQSFAGVDLGAESVDEFAVVHLQTLRKKQRWYCPLTQELSCAPALVTLITELRYCMAALAKAPILAPTGEMRPKFQPRTYADMTNQLANELTTLPNYHARVKFLSCGEHVLQTKPLPPLLTGDALTARIQHIKREMWAQAYTRYYKEVEKEIRERQEQLRGSADSDEPPPTHS